MQDQPDKDHCRELINELRDVAIWESDIEARLTFVSKSVEELVGYPLERWIGGPDVWTNLVHPDDRKWIRQLCVEETRKHHSYRTEFRFVKADGGILWVRKHAYLKVAPDGTPSGMRGVFIDITKEKRIGEDLKQTELRYRIATKATRVVIWEWDLVTNERVWTEGIAELFGYPADTMKGDIYFWYDNIHPDDRERVVMSIHALIDGGKDYWEEEYRFRTGTDSYLFVHDRGQVIRDEKRAPLRMIGAMADITQRKKIEEERYHHVRLEKQSLARAERALRAQEELLSIISHDLTNPLSSILLNTMLAKRSLPGPSTDKRFVVLNRIQQSAERMRVMIQDLVDFGRGQMGNVKVQLGHYSVQNLLKNVVSEVEQKPNEFYGAKVDYENLDHDTTIAADEERLLQAVLKIIRYLARRSAAGAPIHIRSELLGDQVLFRITQPTLVLDKELLPRVFERSGIEMDMPIVQGVIRAHAGRISVTSSDADGTSFYFTTNLASDFGLEEAV